MANANASATYLAKAKASDNNAVKSPAIKKAQTKKQSSLGAFVRKVPLPASYTARSPRRQQAPTNPIEIIEIDSSPETMPVRKAATNFNGTNLNIIERLDAAAPPRTVSASPKAPKPAATPSPNKPTPSAAAPSPKAPKPADTPSPNKPTPSAAAPSPKAPKPADTPSPNKPTPSAAAPSPKAPKPADTPSPNKPTPSAAAPSPSAPKPADTPSPNKPTPSAAAPSPSAPKTSPNNPTPSAAAPSSSPSRKKPTPPSPSSPSRSKGSPRRALPKAGAKARGTGQRAWDCEKYRRTVDADNQSSGILAKFLWVIRLPQCTYQCRICLDQKLRNSFTAKDGTSVISPSELGRHTSTMQHKQAELAAARKMKGVLATTLNEMSAMADKVAEPVVAQLMRTVFYTAKKNQSLRSYVDLAALLAASDATHIKIAGPYQSRPAGMEMLDSLSEVIDKQELKAIADSEFLAITIDESTDRTITHHLALYVSYSDEMGEVNNRYRKLLHIKGSANAAALFDLVKEALEEDGIDMGKVVGFTSDGASVMVGEHKGVAALLKKECPDLLSFHCAAHKLALSCADLFKGDEDLVLLDTMISKIYGHFKVSPLRRDDLRSLQELLGAKEYKLLKPHTVRWLSRSRCIRRLKELYPVLLEYFEQETGPAAETIYGWLKNANNLILTYILDEILGVTAKVSCCFQSSQLALVDVESWLESELRALEIKFTYHKVNDKSNVPPTFSAAINELLASLKESSGRWHGHDLELGAGGAVSWATFGAEVFRKKKYVSNLCTDLIALIRDRFPEEDLGHAAKFRIFSPEVLAAVKEGAAESFGSVEIKALGKWYAKRLGGNVHEEWKLHAVHKLVKHAKQAKAQALGKVPLLAREFYVMEGVWLKRLAPLVWKLVQIMLVMQPASAEVERGFSAMNDIKSWERTQLDLSTLDKLMRVRLCGPEIRIKHQSEDDPPYKEFDERILPFAMQHWHSKKRCAERSCHGPRPKRAAKGD